MVIYTTKVSSNLLSIYLFRIVILSLIGYELLNGFGVLHHSLDYTWQGLIVVSLTAWIFSEIIIKHIKNINKTVFLFLIIFAVLLDAFGDIFHFYSTIHNYDKFLHFFNSGVIAYLVFVVTQDILHKSNLNKAFIFVILVTIGSFFGTLYEIEEFLEDYFINHRQLRLGDGYDTAGDLLMNVSGCIIMTLIVMIFFHNRRMKRIN